MEVRQRTKRPAGACQMYQESWGQAAPLALNKGIASQATHWGILPVLGLLLGLAPAPPVRIRLRGGRFAVGPGHLRADGDVDEEVAAALHTVGPDVQQACADRSELGYQDFEAD